MVLKKRAEKPTRTPLVLEFIENFGYMQFYKGKWVERIFTVSTSKYEIIYSLEKGNIKVYVKQSLLSRQSLREPIKYFP